MCWQRAADWHDVTAIAYSNERSGAWRRTPAGRRLPTLVWSSQTGGQTDGQTGRLIDWKRRRTPGAIRFLHREIRTLLSFAKLGHFPGLVYLFADIPPTVRLHLKHSCQK